MKLRELLPIITHSQYHIFVQTEVSKVTGHFSELNTIDEIKAHFEYRVLAIDENWNITITDSIV